MASFMILMPLLHRVRVRVRARVRVSVRVRVRIRVRVRKPPETPRPAWAC